MYKELNEIKEKLRLLDLYDKYFEFECYDSGSNTALYGYEEDSCYHEIAIVNDEECFFRNHIIKELLEHKNLFFAQHSVFEKPLGSGERSFRKSFSKFKYLKP